MNIMKNMDHFKHVSARILQANELSEEEIFEGNSLLLKFMDLDCKKSRKWIIKCAQYDRSYGELMRVASKIDTFWDDKMTWINGKKSDYKHMMFHQVMDFSYFYRRTVKFVKEYYQWLSEEGV